MGIKFLFRPALILSYLLLCYLDRWQQV